MPTLDATMPARPAAPACSANGEPPDLKTAQQWFNETVAALQGAEADLTAIKAARVPMRLGERERRRSELMDRRATLAARRRELSTWIEERSGGRPAALPSPLRDREVRVDAMHAATRRFVLLEELFTRLQAFLVDPDAVSWVESDVERHIHDLWRPIVDQVETIQNHGAG